MQETTSTRTAALIRYTSQLVTIVNSGGRLDNMGFTQQSHSAADHVARDFTTHGMCCESAVPEIRLTIKGYIAEVFTQGVHGAGTLAGITPQASHMLIDIDPEHAARVAQAIAAITGTLFAEEHPAYLNHLVDNFTDPEAMATRIGEQRQLVERMRQH